MVRIASASWWERNEERKGVGHLLVDQMGKGRTSENGAHWVIAHENPVILMRKVAPPTDSVNLGMMSGTNEMCQEMAAYSVPSMHRAKTRWLTAQILARLTLIRSGIRIHLILESRPGVRLWLLLAGVATNAGNTIFMKSARTAE